MDKVFDLLKGKKTYIAAVAMLALALVSYIDGNVDRALAFLGAAATAAGLRHGMESVKADILDRLDAEWDEFDDFEDDDFDPDGDDGQPTTLPFKTA